MFKIGEFSKLTQVSIRMLRYYDETNLLKPAQIDPLTHYRLYRAEQMDTLNQIIFLRDLGFNVAEIRAALVHWQREDITELLIQKQQTIQEEITTAKAKLAKIELAKKDILQEKMAVHYNVVIKAVPSYQVVSLRRVVADYYQEGLLWKELEEFIKAQEISYTKESLTLYHDPEYKETSVDMEICVGVTEKVPCLPPFSCREITAEPLMAATMVHGPFEKINDSYRAFANWLAEHNQYEMGNHSRQIVHRGPWNETDPAKYLIEIQVPLRLK